MEKWESRAVETENHAEHLADAFFFYYKYNATLNQEDHAPQKLNAGLDNVYVAYLMYPNTAHADRIPSAEGERCISEQSQQPQHV